MSVTNDLLGGKKVSATVIVAIISTLGGGIWSGAQMWDKIQQYDGRISKNSKMSDDIGQLKIDSLEMSARLHDYDLPRMMETLTRLEAEIKSLEKNQERTEKQVTSTGNPLSL
jgi:uncharacterized protein with von Willebrand factor type A (vWA) domain